VLAFDSSARQILRSPMAWFTAANLGVTTQASDRLLATIAKLCKGDLLA